MHICMYVCICICTSEQSVCNMQHILMYCMYLQAPKIIDSLKTVKCISIAAARDHTIIADERYIILHMAPCVHDVHVAGPVM